MMEQWKELKETIIEMRDSGGTSTQQETCKFLANLMDVLEKQMQEPKTGNWIEGKYKDTCDKCRCTYPKNIGFKKFCPNCGTKMVEPQERMK